VKTAAIITIIIGHNPSAIPSKAAVIAFTIGIFQNKTENKIVTIKVAEQVICAGIFKTPKETINHTIGINAIKNSR
jgi:hypothetical protein